MRGWFWTGHYVWSDTASPASLLYSQRITDRKNWEWTLNHAYIRLEAAKAVGELIVYLDTETPNFDAFLATIDGDKEKPDESGFIWKLREGKNGLSVRPRNKAAREGTTSRVELEWLK